MASEKGEFLENLSGTWTAASDWSGTVKCPKAKLQVTSEIYFTLNYLYIDGNPAWFFSNSLKDLKMPNTLQFSGYKQYNQQGDCTFRPTVLWIGKRPTDEVMEMTLFKGKLNEVKQRIKNFNSPVEMKKSKGILRYVPAGNKTMVVVLSQYNNRFFAAANHLRPFLQKENLKNGSYVQFSSFGKFYGDIGDHFHLNYSWVVRTIERCTVNKTNNNQKKDMNKEVNSGLLSASSNQSSRKVPSENLAAPNYGKTKSKKKSGKGKKNRKLKSNQGNVEGYSHVNSVPGATTKDEYFQSESSSSDESSDSDISDAGSSYSACSTSTPLDVDLLKRLDLLMMEMPLPDSNPDKIKDTKKKEQKDNKKEENNSKKEKPIKKQEVKKPSNEENKKSQTSSHGTENKSKAKVYKEKAVQTIATGDITYESIYHE